MVRVSSEDDLSQGDRYADEWAKLRDVCNFFEFLGVSLHEDHIEAEPLFVLVTVDVFKDIENGQPVSVADGVMYSRLKGPIEYLRAVYRPDIYWYYDEYLLPRYKQHKPKKPLAK